MYTKLQKNIFLFSIAICELRYSISDAVNSLISAIDVRPEEKELFVQQKIPIHEEQGRQIRGWLRSGT